MTVRASRHEQRVFAAVPASARSARLFVGDALRRSGADAALINDYQLVVSELASNVIEHGDGSDLVVLVDITDPLWWDVEVADGPTFPGGSQSHPDSWVVAGARQMSGRGLGIVRKLMDDIVIAATGDHVSVRCRRKRQEATT